MQNDPAGPTLEAEFDCLIARAGLTVAPARRAACLLAFADLRSQLALLRTARGATAEPANVFRLTPTEPAR